MEIRTSFQQLKRIKGYLKNQNYYSEQLWTTFLFYSIKNSKDPGKYIKKLINDELIFSDINIWLEAQPLSPKKGKRGKTEGNTVIDIAFGGIKKRKNTKSGIMYDESCNFVCFIEAKLLSDLGKAVTYDPLRNQMIRVMENLIVFQNDIGRGPEKIYFTLLTPRIFKENDKSRFYGYKLNEYKNDKNSIFSDITNCKLENRKDENWEYPEAELIKRIDRLTINWVTYEDILEDVFNMKDMNILKPSHELITIIEGMNINEIIPS